jgi:predicted DNA-binding transcriptional regulator YafY
MNRTDRLLAILLELQAKGNQRAEDLAATFEVSKRTIYRDMLALAESGVPVVSMPGQGYSLVEGYFLPPLSFSTDEAIMLLLGSDFVAQNVDAQYRAAARTANLKIEAVLSSKLREEVAYLQRSIQFIASQTTVRQELLQALRRTIIQRHSVRFNYGKRFTRANERATQTREADPYGLVHIAGVWYLVAYCHLRHDIRNFRLDRIVGELAVLNTPFVRPPDFKITPRLPDDRKVTVHVLFDHETAQWARESRSFFQVAEEKHPDGLLVTLKIRQDEELVQWLLGWGSHVLVLEPNSLRERLAAETRTMLRNYESLPELESLLT